MLSDTPPVISKLYSGEALLGRSLDRGFLPALQAFSASNLFSWNINLVG